MCNMEQKEVEQEMITEIESMEKKAMIAVTSATAAAASVGLLPIPLADSITLIGIQVGMMVGINSVFKIDLKKDAIKSLIFGALGVSGVGTIGRAIFSSLVKVIPGVGSVTGGILASVIGGTLTLSLGKAYIEICKMLKRGSLDLNDMDKVKETFKGLYKKEVKDSSNKEYAEAKAREAKENKENLLLSDEQLSSERVIVEEIDNIPDYINNSDCLRVVDKKTGVMISLIKYSAEKINDGIVLTINIIPGLDKKTDMIILALDRIGEKYTIKLDKKCKKRKDWSELLLTKNYFVQDD